jgi:LytS/YehU family sensor histidine kinase
VLAAQVEPHFLFNTLAGVRSAIATDPARASDMIDRLVDYLRASIPRLRSDGGGCRPRWVRSSTSCAPTWG